MAAPYFQAMILRVLRAARAGEIRPADIEPIVADELALSEEDRSEARPSGGETRLMNRIHWAATYLAKAGLLTRPRRGYLAITDRGRRVLDTNPSKIDIRFLSQFEEFRSFKTRTRQAQDEGTTDVAEIVEENDQETPDDIMRAAHRRIEDALAQELIERILAGTPAFFERLIVRLLLAMGYGGSMVDAGKVLGRSGDDGVDGVIDQDALGLDRVYVQAKRYKPGNTVGSGAIRDFFGSLDRHKAAKGLFVTTSTFSPSARETAEYLSKRIVLVDGDQLATLMIRHGVGCRVEDTLYIKKIDEDFFE